MTHASRGKNLADQTARLWRSLQQLVRAYPEDGLSPDQTIFNRILTHDWRHAHGEVYGPHERRYWEAVGWVNQFDSYTRNLRDYCLYELVDPQRLASLPLTGRFRIPAPECIRLLRIQSRMVMRWSSKAVHTRPPADSEEVEPLRSGLQKRIEGSGVKTVAAECGLSRDTLEDFVNGKTKPQTRTVKRLRDYLKV